MAAVTDFRIEVGFFQHRKTRRLQRRLGDGAVLALMRFWEAVAVNAPTGYLRGWDEGDIEDAAGWTGQPGSFVEGILDAEFLDRTEDGFRPHNWETRQPWAFTAGERTVRARHAANARYRRRNAPSLPEDDRQECTEHASSNADSMPDACGGHADSNAPSPSPSPSPKNPPTPLSGGGGDLGAKAPEDPDPDLDRQERVVTALNAWNRILAGTRLVLPPGAGPGEHCIETLDIPPGVAGRVDDIATAVRRSRKLREEAPWCSFPWAMKPRNADKLLSGHWPPDAPILAPTRFDPPPGTQEGPDIRADVAAGMEALRISLAAGVQA